MSGEKSKTGTQGGGGVSGGRKLKRLAVTNLTGEKIPNRIVFALKERKGGTAKRR